jgi:hypothetical protein
MRADEECTFVFVFRGAKRVNYGRSNTLPARPQPTLNSPKFAPSAPTRRLWGPRAALFSPSRFSRLQIALRGRKGGQPQATRSCGKPRPASPGASAVLVVPEDRLPLIPAIHHVVNRSRILHSELSAHPANRVCTSRQISQALQILCKWLQINRPFLSGCH